MNDRNISGTFNNKLGLGNTYAQHEAGVNSWDTSISAQTKIAVQNISKYGLPPTPVKKSPLYGLAFKLGQMFK
ncbi:hypothetical protein ACSFBI_05055 [Variovorax sp. RB3P1]|uniref:hypothetical protein n=1 Tax=Variovorax sp. RB3P1 TaxID=3443732 RepID=UPI003F459196